MWWIYILKNKNILLTTDIGSAPKKSSVITINLEHYLLKFTLKEKINF